MVKLLPIILRKPLSTSFEQRLLPKLSRTQQPQQVSQTMDLDVRVYSAKDFNSGNKNPLIPFQPQKQNLPMQGRIRISEANGAPILLLRIKFLLIVNILPLPRQKTLCFGMRLQ